MNMWALSNYQRTWVLSPIWAGCALFMLLDYEWGPMLIFYGVVVAVVCTIFDSIGWAFGWLAEFIRLISSVIIFIWGCWFIMEMWALFS